MWAQGVQASFAALAILAAAPATGGSEQTGITLAEHALPGEQQRPQAIALGPDGNVWVTEVMQHQIFRITPEGEATAFRVPGDAVGVLQGIAAGPDGNIWFTSREENAIRRISPSGAFNGKFDIPSRATEPTEGNKGAWPRGITAGPDGRMWFAEMAANKIGSVTIDGTFAEFEIPTANAKPYGIVTGPDRKLWFTQSGTGKIGRIDPRTGAITEFPLSDPQSRPRDITVGPDGHLWFAMNGTNHVGRISTNGTVTEFPLPPGSEPIGIAPGPDGNIWFTAFRSHRIGRITPAGVVTFFDLRTANAQPFGMAPGPGGAVWFTLQANHVGTVVLPPRSKN